MRLYVSRITQRYWSTYPVEERDRIAAAVPDGYRLVLAPGHRAQPGTTTVSLRTDDNREVVEARGRNLAGMCWYVLRRLPSEHITVNADGTVSEWEPVA